MSTTDPTGDRGGGGGGGLASITPFDDNVTPVTSSTGVAVSPASHHQQHPPPSPLSGCYLLVVLPEPHTAQHKDLILNRLAKGFLSWDKDSCHVDLEKELQALVAQAPEGEEARNGERLIQYATENLVTEVLIHPQTNTLLQCMRNLLASFTKHRHIIHAGYTFSGNGSWILQDGTFSLADFLDAFSEHEVQRVLRAYENSVTVDINCADVGEWSTSRLSKEACTRSCRVRLNPDDVLTAGVPAITSFTSYVGQYLVSQTLDQLMEPSDVVGNIRFSHPTLYVFPGGQGDAALFGINGFNMLVDGGFARKACFWDFARHLDRLDAVLMTRINNSNVGGMSSVLRKKREMHVYPQIGHFFCNLIERKNLNSPDGDKDLDPLILNLTDIGHEMMVDLRHINLRAHPCYRDPNPINLYHKVGHGTLDMYVLSPSKDSREVREFLSKWHASDSKLFSGSFRKDSNNLTFPIQNLASICALLVWQPANPEDTITRILFPGSTPQHKIFEGIERLKHLEFLKHPVCTAKSISPSTSLLTLKDKPTTKQKLGLIEESRKASDAKKDRRDLLDSKLSKTSEDVVSKPTPQGTPINQPPKVQTPKIDVKTKKVIENKKIETESKKIEKDLKEHKKEPIRKDFSKTEKDSDVKKVEGYKIRMDNEKAALTKEPKAKPEPKKKETKESKPVKIGKAEPMSKAAVRMGDKKQKPPADKKDAMKASPTTPKKSMNGAATKVELSRTTPRPITKPSSKPLSSTMPAKSAKDANNRKVVEQKNIEIASAESAAAPASTKVPPKQKTAERKPIGRRPKPISPIKARLPISPTKSTRSTPTTSVKSDKDGIIRKIKGDRGTADSSTVSTPSGIEIDSMTKLADKCLTEKSEDMSLDSIESKVLADLKEEREVVEEIEAVLQKAERIEGARRDDHLEGDDDITAEATDKKEDDMTEDDVTADIEEIPKKEGSRKTSHELTEEDEYLIIEKEEIYIEDSVQSGEVEEKHATGVVDDEEAKTGIDAVPTKEEEEEEEDEVEQEEAEVSEGKEKADIPEKQLGLVEGKLKETVEPEKLASSDEILEEQMKNIIASTAEMVQKTDDKDDSGKKDSEDITKEPSSLSPDKFDSSEKKTTDTDVKPEIDQKDRQVPGILEESHERMSTLESGATTTAPTLPEDERIPLDEIKEVVDERCLVDQETKPDGEIKVSEPLVAQIPPETKPDAKAFEVHPPLHGIQREIVKTPDEVADLPVHEEVDPTLYRMEHYEKGKEEKPMQAAAPQKEVKEPEIPIVKEQKGVFSFFGKVADKFEKGIDKLTGKSRRDSEKDIDEKSSSKSGSPKEVKAQSIVFPGEVAAEGSAGMMKVAEASEIPEAFEKGIPEITKVKVAAIKDTASFLADEIEDLKKTSPLYKEPSDMKDETAMTKLDSETDQSSKPLFETCVPSHMKEKLDEVTAELEGEDDVEEVEALLAEASKKFKDVKDSLHDSLESLEEKIAEQEMARAELHAVSQDFVKDTLSEVVEKLEDMKPKDLDELEEKKEHEETGEAPGDEEDLDDKKDEAIVTKDLKGAVRDVGEVLAGSAGILIDDKPKDVIEIVKKVAEVLKKDDFLSHDVLFDSDATEVKDKIGENEISSAKLSTEAAIIPKRVGVTEESPSQEEIEELQESRRDSTISSTAQKPVAADESHEDITKASKIQTPASSPTIDTAKDKIEAMKICAEFLDDEPILSRQKRSEVEDPTKKDVVEAGMEAICVKQKIEKPTSTEGEAHHELKEQNIIFDRKVSPVTAEVVIVTPDLSPTSPMLPSEKIHTEDAEAKPEVSDVSQLLPSDILNALQNEESLEKIIEELVYTKNIKITREFVEYIIIIRKISRYDVIRIIEQLISKKGSLPESVVTDINILVEDLLSNDKREDIENYINKEYIMNNKKITMKIIEDISNQKGITKRILITIITEIIIKKNIPRGALLDLSEKEFSQFDLYESVTEEQDKLSQASEISGIEVDDGQEITSSDKYTEVRTFIENELIAKGQKITPQLIDDVCVAKLVPRRIFIEIIEKIMIERKIPRSSMVDISEKEMSELLASEKEHEVISKPEEDEDGDADQSGSSTPDRGQEIASYISDEFITKKKKITLQSFNDICARNDVSVQMLWNLIDNVIEKQKLDRAVVMDISENELADLLTVEEEEIIKEDDTQITSLALNRSEIENSIVEEFVSKNRRITPYIFEDICLRYKVPRRIIIEIIETIIIKRNLQRNSILDITDTELSELLAVVEAQDEEESEDLIKSPVKEQERQDDASEDKLVDGFVSITSTDDVKTEDVLRKKSVEPVAKESEKDVDDFEAVEQEYKIYGLSLTPDKELPVTSQSISDEKILDEVEDIVHDHISDVVEAKEKIVGTASKPVSATKTEEKSQDISELSETIDTTEKYLMEAKEKIEVEVSKSKSVSASISDIKPSELPTDKDAYDISDGISINEKSVMSVAHGGSEGEAKLVKSDITLPKPTEVTSPELPDNDAMMDATARKPSTTGYPVKQEESRKIELDEESEKIEDEMSITVTKRDSHGSVDGVKKVTDTEDVTSQPGSVSPKDDKSSKETSINEETPLSSSTVHRMVVTASSEDGGHEMEVCPTGSITFTPDDSLKSSPIKTTPDQDSLRLDKEPIHSGTSTPERDSISDKSATGTKDQEKITPEDSLDKSPSGTRDSQDLEDSLDKSDLIKLKETKAPERLSKEQEDAAIDHISDDEKSKRSHDGSPTIDTVSATETSTRQIEPSKVSVEEPVEKADISEKPSSLATEIQSAIERNIGADISDRTGVVASKVSDEPIVQTKSPSPSEDHESDVTSDRLKRSSIFNETKHDAPKSLEVGKLEDKVESLQVKKPEEIVCSSTLDGQHDASPQTLEPATSPFVDSHKHTPVDSKDFVATVPSPIVISDGGKSDKLLADQHEEIASKDLVAKSETVTSGKSPTDDVSISTEMHDDKDSMTRSRSPSITAETHDERKKISHSRSPSVGDYEHDHLERIDSSISPIVSAETQDEISDVGDSKQSSMATEKKDGKSPTSPTIALERQDEKKSFDGSKSHSMAGEKELTDRSRSASLTSEKQGEIESADRSVSPSVAVEEQGEKETVERSRSPSIGVEKEDEEALLDHSQAPSVTGEREDDKESMDRSRSPSVVTKKHDEKEKSDRSKSPSTASEKGDEKEFMDRSKSPSVASEKEDGKESVDRSRLTSLASERQDEMDAIDRSKSPSIVTETPGAKESIDRSKSPSVASEKDEKESIDGSRSPSAATEKHDDKETVDRSKSPSVISEKESIDRSRSPSVATDKQSEKDSVDHYKSPSVASEKADIEQTIERSRSPSVTTEKQDPKDLVDHAKSPSTEDKKESVGRLRTTDIVTEKYDEKEPIDHSGSPSLATEKQNEIEKIDRSKPPSVASEKDEEREAIDRSRSPSVATEKPCEKGPMDGSKSPSVASEKDVNELIDRSRSPSLAPQKQDEKLTIDGSKSPSVESEKDEKEFVERLRSASLAPEKEDEKEPMDRSRSPSVVTEKQDVKETIDRPKSPSVHSEKDERESIDRSRSPSLTTEKQDEKEINDRPKSPSAASEKDDEKKSLDRSRSPSVATEKQDEKEAIDRSKSPSVASEKEDYKESIDRSRSASVTTEKHDTKESIDRSKSPSVASEKGDDKESIDRSRSPSVATEKQDEKEIIDRSKSPSIASEKETIDRSGSVSPAIERQDGKVLIDRSRSPSVAIEKQDEKGSSDRSKSPSVASEKEEEKASQDRSRSASLALERPDGKDPTDRSKSPSVAGDIEDEKEDRSISPNVVVEKRDEKELSGGSRSPSISPAKEDTKELFVRSRSSSIASEKQSDRASVDHSRFPSIDAEKSEEKEPVEIARAPSAGRHDEKETTDGSISPSTAGQKQDKSDVVDRSRSPSIVGEKQDEKESSDRSRSASMVTEQLESIDRSKSPSLAGEKQDEKELFDRLRSPSISGPKQDITELVDRSKSPSVAEEKRDGEVIDRSRSSSILGEHQAEKQSIDRSRSASVASEKPDGKDSIEGSKPPSIASEKQDEKESIDRSRSASIVSRRSEEKESMDQSRSPSIVGEKQDEVESVARSRSASVAVGKQDEKEAIARSRSASIAVGHEEQELMDRSSSGSITAEKGDEKKTVDRSRSSSVVVEKKEEEELFDRSRSGSVAVEKETEKEFDEKYDDSKPIDSFSLSDTVSRGQVESDQFDRSRLANITSQKTTEKPLADGSRSASISPQEHIETEPADRSRSSSTVAVTVKEAESIAHSRSPSIIDGTKDAEQLIDHSDSPDLSKTAVLKKPTGVIESDIMTTQRPTDIVGETSPKDGTEIREVSPSPSATSEQQDTNESVDGSRSPSIASRKLSLSNVIADENIDTEQKHKTDEPIDLSSAAPVEGKMNGVNASKRPSIIDAHSIDEKSPDSRKESVASVVIVQDSKLDATDAVQAMQKLAETIADKSLACDIKDSETSRDVGIIEHDIIHDEKRSHSSSEAGEKTPKSRSPTASLIDDEVPGVLKPSDQAMITKDDESRKSSMADISPDKVDQLPSDSNKFCTTGIEGALPKRGSVEIAKDIAGRFADDYHTTSDKIAEIEEYIVNKYIAKKERISPQIVEDIVSLYSISRHIILELIEAIIIEKNVPRDVIVSFPKDDGTKVSAIVSENDHVDVIDIPPAKQQEIETRIYQEFVTKNKKITSLVINELAAMTYISRHIIIMIIQKMIRDQKGLTPDLLEHGILDESTTKNVQSEATHEQSHESRTLDEKQIESNLLSESTDVMSYSDAVSEDKLIIPDSKRMEIETYIMEECVKKRIKINLLVFEQIIMRTGVPRSVLLSVIDKIILSGKIPRAEIVDDAIYDEVEKASDKLCASEEKGFREPMSSKDRVTELSGKSTPDPKSSGYSTPEVRHYDDKFDKGMVSYSHDYESPFHKAFVGGMTEIRTTHITTLSGKSTPDYTVRGETPESLSESTSQTKLDEKFGLDSVASSQKTTSSVHTTDATATTFTTTVHTVTKPVETSHLKDEMVTREIFSDQSEIAKKDAVASKTDHCSGSDEDQPEVIKKVITREVVEETTPVTEITIHKKEIVEQLPEMDSHCDVHKISRIVQETSSPETIEIVTVKTIETIVTEDITPETMVSKLGSLDGTQDISVTEHTMGDVKTVTTTVTMMSDPQTMEEIVGESTSRSLEKEEDKSHTTTQIISKVTYSAPLDSQQTDKFIQDVKEAATASPTTITSVIPSRTDRDASVEDSPEREEKSKSASQMISERMGFEKLDHPISPVIKDLISDQRSFTGRTSPDVVPGKEGQQGGSMLPSATDVPGSPFFRDSGMGHAQLSGRSTPDKRGASRSSTATPEGMRSNEVIRTTITTTRTMSDEGDIITTTMEITETTNEKGETIILAEKTDVKVEDRIIPGDMSKSTLTSGFEALKAPADLTGEADVDQVSPRSDHSSVQSRAGTHIWGSSEERYTYSDDDVPGSPLSTTSQVGYSPQSTYAFDDHSFDKGPSRKSMEFSVADMSASFYGELPDLPPRVTTIKTTHLDSSDTEAQGSSEPTESDFSFKKFTVAKEFAGISRDGKPDGKKYIDDADLDFEKALTEQKETKTEKEVSRVVESSSSHATSSSQSQSGDKKPEPKSDSKKDPLAGWGSPLGLPSPKPPRKFNLRSVTRPTINVVDESPDSINFDPINDWGEPLRLPSPAPVVDEGSNKGAPSTPKKERKQPKKILSENIKNRKRSESPAKSDKKTKDAKAKIQPVYIDLTYVPHHGNSYYTSVEFFKRVRARYYVFSGTEPSREVYDALLDAKKTWEDKDLEVTMIPTYDTDTLGYWVADNEEALAANHIDLSPSASRCTINLQDHETSCSAYRLEF